VPTAAPESSAWLEAASAHPAFLRRLAPAAAGEGCAVLDHVDPAAHAWLIAMVRRALPGRPRLWVLGAAPKRREQLALELELWDQSAEILPDAAEGEDPEGAAERLATLEALTRLKRFTVLADGDVFSQPAPDPEALAGARLRLAIGQRLDPTDLATRLADHGYQRESLVQGRGQFTVRGGIVDLFPFHAADPLRLEFFDDEIESIRRFDLDTQGSVGRLDHAEILLGEPPAEHRVDDFLRPDDLVVFLGEPDQAPEPAHLVVCQGADPAEPEENYDSACFAHPLGRFEAGDFVLEQSRREQFLRQLGEWREQDWRIGIVFARRAERERFEELLPESAGAWEPLRGELFESFTVPAAGLAILSSSEIFGRYRHPAGGRRSRLDRQRQSTARRGIEEIDEGDLVVHSEYGIGCFAGIREGDDGEEIAIEYRDGAMLAVPIDHAHLVGKYIGLGGRAPELSKLGGGGWRKTRSRAEQTILDYAARLLRTQAARQSVEGFAHPPDSRWMWEFENSFHFTETPDQRQAIEATKRDMESPRPMDRLICGDVGFGKTEVAIRAAFKAVTGGKQVAFLCPTTVLAEQHWRTFRERMSDYPLRIELLNRFRSAAETRATLRGLADGSVDIVIGTHRLLSEDIHFKDLGLAVVDEEQRFGVKHKERFKEIFRQVDLLTLSATPIPRTLYMALMGARDMSTIDTPPPNRRPVRTTVAAYDERLIREAIERELHRGGQVFFLHNRVKSIELVRKRLTELLPDARLLVGHGQMARDELEVVMRRFVEGEADILLATTIIETGIDIPNANTILIDRADRFGLADLYQLRGRVGRAGETAYAILLLPRELMAQGDARKRIHAIQQYTALGSGFKIAMRDLEIRGAGNLLGTKQSGQIAAVGFDLYCQLLRESVERLQGKTPERRVDTTFRSDFTAFSPVEHARGSGDGPLLACFLPHDWLPETRLRVTAYRELAEVRNEKELDQLVARWADRFGRLPEPARQLAEVARLRLLAGSRRIESIEIKGQRLMLQRNGDFIMLEGRRFPRLDATHPAAMLRQAIDMVRSL